MKHTGWRSKSKEVSLLWREQRKEGRNKGEQGESKGREREFWQIISFSLELVTECFPVSKALHTHHFILPHVKPVRQTGQGSPPWFFFSWLPEAWRGCKLPKVSEPVSGGVGWICSVFLTAELISEGRGTKKFHILRLAEHEPGLPWLFSGKESAFNTQDQGPIPGSGRPPGEGNGNPLQYSFLGNPMDRGAWRVTVQGVARSRTRLSVDTPHTETRRWSRRDAGQVSELTGRPGPTQVSDCRLQRWYPGGRRCRGAELVATHRKRTLECLEMPKQAWTTNKQKDDLNYV